MSGSFIVARKAAVAALAILLFTMPGLADAPSDDDAAKVAGEVDEILAIEGDRAYGNYLAGECATCHRRSGPSDGIPAIAGLEAEAFVTAMAEYRAGLRPNDVMRTTAMRLSHEEIAALAAHFSGLDAP